MHAKRIALGLVCFLFLAFTLTSDLKNPFENIFGNLETYKSIKGPEKVYVHTDKDFYTNGETLWFKAYLVDGVDHLPSGKSKVVYVELLDQKDSIVAQRKLYTDSLGASGDILLDKKLKEGTYLLRSYTKYMLNETNPILFEKEVRVWYQSLNPLETISGTSETIGNNEAMDEKLNTLSGNIQPVLNFYPEGGNLVAGLESIVGLKATDGKGNGVELEGHIADEEGKVITRFRTYKFGLGKTRFIPEKGKTYIAEISGTQGAQFVLPKVLDSGYTLSVKNNNDHVVLEMTSNVESGLEGVLLLGHMRGNTFFKYIEKSREKKSHSTKLIYKDLQDGVAHFTLFTPDGKPICERLTFINNRDNDISLKLQPKKIKYNTRENVLVDVMLTDKMDKPVEGDFSLNVVNKNSKMDGVQPASIESWLLLDSDLGATVEDPNYFFIEGHKEKKRYMLDALMLTHGWRRFLWTDFIKNEVQKKPLYQPEKGIMISGKTTAVGSKLATKPAMVTLNILENGIFQEKQETSGLGEFSFGPFIFNDSIKTVIQTSNIAKGSGKPKKNNLAVHIDSPVFSPSIKRLPNKETNELDLIIAEDFLKDSKERRRLDFKYDPLSVELDAIEITVKKKTRQEIVAEELNQLTSYGTPSDRVFTDSIPGMEAASAIDLLTRVGGVQIRGAYPNQRIVIRGASSFMASTDPLFLINGNPVPADVFSALQASEISFIDVLKGSDAAFYGTRGTNGVVAAYTYHSNSLLNYKNQYPGVANFYAPGFYSARVFYTPNYSVKKETHKKPDYRSTLYWNPYVTKREVSFFTGDNQGVYIINLEGLTKAGQPVKAYCEFEVVNDLN